MKQVRIIIESDHDCTKLGEILNTHTKILHRKEVHPDDIEIDISLPNPHTCGLYTGIIKYKIETENSPL